MAVILKGWQSTKLLTQKGMSFYLHKAITNIMSITGRSLINLFLVLLLMIAPAVLMEHHTQMASQFLAIILVENTPKE